MEEEVKNENRNALARTIATWIVLLGMASFGTAFLAMVVEGTFLGDKWFLDVAKEHFAAVVGLPAAALAALFVVSVFEVTIGPIEFEAIGFKFRGASGPIVLWVMCFAVIAAAIKLLW